MNHPRRCLFSVFGLLAVVVPPIRANAQTLSIPASALADSTTRAATTSTAVDDELVSSSGTREHLRIPAAQLLP